MRTSRVASNGAGPRGLPRYLQPDSDVPPATVLRWAMVEAEELGDPEGISRLVTALVKVSPALDDPQFGPRFFPRFIRAVCVAERARMHQERAHMHHMNALEDEFIKCLRACDPSKFDGLLSLVKACMREAEGNWRAGFGVSTALT